MPSVSLWTKPLVEQTDPQTEVIPIHAAHSTLALLQGAQSEWHLPHGPEASAAAGQRPCSHCPPDQSVDTTTVQGCMMQYDTQ